VIRLQRSLSGAGSWELESGDDLSMIAESSLSADRIPGSNYGFYTAAPTKNKIVGGGIATIEASRDESRRFAARAVFHSLDETETYAMVLQQSGPLGFRNLWETGVDNPPSINGSFSASAGEMYYTNLHPLLLPGGSILPAKSRGYLLSGGSGKPLVIRWSHKHSGWSLLLEILAECAGRIGKSGFNSSMTSPAAPALPAHLHVTHPQHKRGSGKPIPFTLSAIGIDFSTIDIPNLVIEILDLFRSVIMHKEDASHVALFESMEQPNDSAMIVEPFEDDQSNDSVHKRKMDLTQVVVQILSEALVRVGSKRAFSNAANAATQQDLKMITSAISALSAVARVLPQRVWPLMRSTGLIGLAGGGYGFGASPSNYISTNGSQGYQQQSTTPHSTTIAVLASERATGSYRITLSILSLVRSLFDNAVASDLSTSVRVDLKGEVLTNALRFIHTSIWCEHFSWKYKRLGDRFDIGRRIMGLYCDVLRNWTANEGGEVRKSVTIAVHD
jgi:nuclear pore complex protein Nup188